MTAHLEQIHPVVMAGDVAAAIQFYGRLGFTVTFQDDATNPKYVGVRRDNVELHIQWADESQWAYPTDRPAYRFAVDDVDGLYAELEAAGAIRASTSPWAAPANTPWGTREFHVRDPGQNSLQFYRQI